MANRFLENVALLAKVETTQNEDAVPTAADNAMLIDQMEIIPLEAENIDRNLLREYFGGSEQLQGTVVKRIKFGVEMAGAGTAGAVPPWFALLQMCGMAVTDETVYASAQPDTPAAQRAGSLYAFDSGVRHRMIGTKGNARINLMINTKPRLEFDMLSLYSAPTAVAVPTTTLTTWKKPEAVTQQNTADLLLGCTYAAAALSSGTAYPSRGLSIDLGNTVNFSSLLGEENVDIDGRDVTGAVELSLTAAQEVSFAASVLANTTQSFGLEHGSTAGYIVGVYMPAVQLVNYRHGALNKRRLMNYDLRILPSAGNDDIVIYAKCK